MRFFRPGFVVFCVAILASLFVHLPVYTVLGKLADVLLREEAKKPANEPIEFEIAALDEEALKPNAEPEPQEEAQRQPSVPSPSKEPEEKKAPAPQQKQAEAPKPKPNLNVVPTPAPPAQPAPPQEQPNKLAVEQKSDDPTVPPPDDARFTAEENRRVAEESIASVTNLQVDDPETAIAPHESTHDDATGETEEDTKLADLKNVEGEDSRIPNEREAQAEQDTPSQPSQGEQNADAVTSAPMQGGAPGAQSDKPALAAGSEAVGGEEEVVVIEDGMGRIRIRRSLAGHGPGEAGGESQRGAANAQHAQQQGARTGRGANLNLSWSQFESTFGAEQLQEQRNTYLAQQRSKTQGGNRELEWKKFRSAIENFVPNVKSGNQTALNAAASPFAAYLAAVHRRIHREFAMRFLRDLPLVGGPYNDYSLFTKLEIVINGDGTLHKVGVVQSSGYLPYDYGAWNSVERAAPYPQPPNKILSGDGRVYFRWGFYRNERQCGTFNAEPYILPNPAGVPSVPGPLHDDGPSDGPSDASKFGALTPPGPNRSAAAAAATQDASSHAHHQHSWTH